MGHEVYLSFKNTLKPLLRYTNKIRKELYSLEIMHSGTVLYTCVFYSASICYRCITKQIVHFQISYYSNKYIPTYYTRRATGNVNSSFPGTHEYILYSFLSCHHISHRASTKNYSTLETPVQLSQNCTYMQSCQRQLVWDFVLLFIRPAAA